MSRGTSLTAKISRISAGSSRPFTSRRPGPCTAPVHPYRRQAVPGPARIHGRAYRRFVSPGNLRDADAGPPAGTGQVWHRSPSRRNFPRIFRESGTGTGDFPGIVFGYNYKDVDCGVCKIDDQKWEAGTDRDLITRCNRARFVDHPKRPETCRLRKLPEPYGVACRCFRVDSKNHRNGPRIQFATGGRENSCKKILACLIVPDLPAVSRGKKYTAVAGNIVPHPPRR